MMMILLMRKNNEMSYLKITNIHLFFVQKKTTKIRVILHAHTSYTQHTVCTFSPHIFFFYSSLLLFDALPPPPLGIIHAHKKQIIPEANQAPYLNVLSKPSSSILSAPMLSLST